MRGDRAWFLLVFLTFAWFTQGGFANSNARFDLSLSIAMGHRYDIDPLAFNTIDRVRIGKHFYSEKAPGTAYLALPVAAAAATMVDLAALERSPPLADGLLHLATALSAGLLSALAAVAFRRLLSRLDPRRSHRSAWLLTAAVFLGTPLFVYSTVLFGHAIAAAWLTIGAWSGYEAARSRGPRPGRAALAALALGLAVLTEYPAVPPAAALGAGLLAVARRPRNLLVGTGAAGVPLALLMIHQNAAYGSPLAVGYGRLTGTPFATRMAEGFFGITLPDGGAALQLLFGTYRGLFVYGPILVVAVAGFAMAPRPLRRRLAPAMLMGAGALWLVIAGYAYWQGGPAFGPRHLVPAIPLLGLGLAWWPDRPRWNGAAAALAAVSVGINLVGAATTPFVSEFNPDPIVSVYPRLAAEGAMSINPVSFLTPAAEVDERWAHLERYPLVTRNLGERLGLGGWMSVLPLALLWACAIVGESVKRPAPAP